VARPRHETSACLRALIGCRTAETEIEAADAYIAQRPDIGGDQRRGAGKQAMLTITGLWWRSLAEHL
jgi:hypothetical protein